MSDEPLQEPTESAESNRAAARRPGWKKRSREYAHEHERTERTAAAETPSAEPERSERQDDR